MDVLCKKCYGGLDRLQEDTNMNRILQITMHHRSWDLGRVRIGICVGDQPLQAYSEFEGDVYREQVG